MDRDFMFTVTMLSDMTGINRQHLSRKVKKMIENPEIHLHATIRSNKEGYRIPESEVLRCFEDVTPEQIQLFKSQQLKQQMTSWNSFKTIPEPKKLTNPSLDESQTAVQPSSESDLLLQWRVRLAASLPSQKYTPEMRRYLEEQLALIRQRQKEKLLELVKLELLLDNFDRTIRDLQDRLNEWPEGCHKG